MGHPLPADASRVLAELPCFLSLLDASGNILWASRYAYGCTAKELVGKPSDAIVVEEDRPLWWDVFRRALHLGETTNYALRGRVPAPPGLVRIVGRIGPVRRGRKRLVGVVTYDPGLAAEPFPLARHLFGDLPRRAVVYLLGNGRAKGATIGRHVGEITKGGQATPKLRVLLADLVERNVLAHGPGGYSISPDFKLLATELRLGDRQSL